MKNLFMMVLFLIMSQQYVLAESEKDCKPGDKFIKQMQLGDEQVEPVKKILEQQHEKRRTIREEHREAKQKKMESLHDETKSQLAGILTDEQMSQFNEISAKRKDKMEKRRVRHKEIHQKSSMATDIESPVVSPSI